MKLQNLVNRSCYNYKLEGREKLECQARVNLCDCGILYTQPIVSKNGTVEVQLFVGSTSLPTNNSNNKLVKTEVATESELDSLIFDIANHHYHHVMAIHYVYSKKQLIMMTPLCGAIFSRDCVTPISEKLHITLERVIAIINTSTCSGGQYLNDSDIACAIVAAICATKRVTNKGARDMIITKIVKQYAAKHKQFIPEHFSTFSEYALGGVPPGMDAESLIENNSNIQIAAINRRIAATAAKETITTAPAAGLVNKAKLATPRMPY
ncbi:unnamed protein product [Spodoptera exigua]|nr:unnamed protein product [Spodoptera exigua]